MDYEKLIHLKYSQSSKPSIFKVTPMPKARRLYSLHTAYQQLNVISKIFSNFFLSYFTVLQEFMDLEYFPMEQ